MFTHHTARKAVFLLSVLCMLLLVPPLLFGCGSGAGTINPATIPDACGQEINRPNYCGDLASLNYFPQPVITYRIVGSATATDIYTGKLVAEDATEAQKAKIRAGFTAWGNELQGYRQIVEVPESDTSALIDVAVQKVGYFQATRAEGKQPSGNVNEIVCRDEDKQSRAFLEPLAVTSAYWSNKSASQYGRAVIRMRNDLTDEKFGDVVAHEAGHALGIDGHSRAVLDLMFPLSLPVIGAHGPTRRDGNTARAIYEDR